MRRMVPTVAVTVLAGIAVVGGVFVAVTAGAAFLNDSVRGCMGVSRAFELQSAAAQGDLVTVRAILRSEPDLVNARDEDGWTPLHEAARAGYVRVADLLIKSGAEVDARDHLGATPLNAAARAGEMRVVRFLLAHGARVTDSGLPGLAARRCKG